MTDKKITPIKEKPNQIAHFRDVIKGYKKLSMGCFVFLNYCILDSLNLKNHLKT
jgi:hypothetical protein